MRDDLGRRRRSGLQALAQVMAAAVGDEESRGEQVAGTGGVDHLTDRRRRDLDADAVLQAERAISPTSDHQGRQLRGKHVERLTKAASAGELEPSLPIV